MDKQGRCDGFYGVLVFLFQWEVGLVSRLYRVLIVDNNLGTFDRLKKMSVWQENGFEIYAKTSDSENAAAYCLKNSIDLMVCFNRLPAISAEAVISAVKNASPKTVCLAVSPFDDSENMRKCFLLGVIDYINEPVSESRLSEALARAAQLIGSTFVAGEYALTVEEFLGNCETQDEKFRERLREFLRGCENTTVTTENAADHFGFNKDYFGRLFKSKMGMTFGEFYKHFRILYAEKLLLSGRYKVYEVSAMLGFSSVDYFTTVFKKITGKTPSEMKK